MPVSSGSTHWDSRYGEAGDDFVFGTAPNDFLAARAPAILHGSVLCLAEGEGRNAVHLATLGHVVTAVDQSAVGLAKANRLAAHHGVKLTNAVTDLAARSFPAWSGKLPTKLNAM